MVVYSRGRRKNRIYRRVGRRLTEWWLGLIEASNTLTHQYGLMWDAILIGFWGLVRRIVDRRYDAMSKWCCIKGRLRFAEVATDIAQVSRRADVVLGLTRLADALSRHGPRVGMIRVS
ncbi:hypothetical protein B296_00017965 [Ensete ventricosum]|uniref:Uncharacterized protein n=1 Tax=Ensete ventricosum TaxID=4639 RepID=A0A426ZVI9_ENSVE|nr:hypothetical protein B296_00017965 [Ensete ventricosum]